MPNGFINEVLKSKCNRWIRENLFFFCLFCLIVHPSPGKELLAPEDSEADSPHPEFFREIFRRVGAEPFTRIWVLEYPTQTLENELQRGVHRWKKKIPQARTRLWILAGCHCKHSLYWHCRAYCQWPVGIGFPEAQEIHFSSEGERSDTSWSSPEELWQMCHSNLTAPWKNINSEVCWFL